VQTSTSPLTLHISTYPKERAEKGKYTHHYTYPNPGPPAKITKKPAPLAGNSGCLHIQHGKEINEQFLYITA